MSEHLTGLFYTLEKAGLHLDPEGARDALWLALHVTEPLVQLAPPGPPAEQQVLSSERAPDIADLEREKLTTGPEDDLIGETSSQDTGLDVVEGGQVAPQFLAARRLRLPAAPALPGSREVMRSMRPLRRKAVSSISRWVDEEATVRRAVEEDIWLPVFRPVPERWLNLALVIDRSLSMIVWDAMVKELRRVLQGSGAFRSIQLWWLDTESEKLMLYARDPGRSNGPAARHLREVAGGGQRTLVTVLTDCVSRGWYNGNVTRAIFNWSRSAPVSLLQVLPERMWSRTALGDAERVRLRASDAAVTNAHLSAGTELPLSDLDIDPGIRQLQLPVVPLDPQSLNLLARMVAGTSSQWTPGVIISLDEEAGPGIEPMPPPAINPAERVQRFWNLASSQAIRLASILAASPVLNMDLLRIIRRELLPDAQLVHEAEVILGGLLKIRTPEAGAAQKDRAYELEFFKGVKSYLLNNATVNEVLAVLSKVAEHHEIPGINRQFIEMLVADPAAASGSIDSADSAAEPASANIAQVLERLGGAYARAVKRQPATEKQKAPPSSARGWQPRIVHQLQPAQPFIGRQHFLKLLTDWWERPEFEPPVKVVLGEGGAGKTALAAEFLKAIRPQRRKDAGTFVWSFHQEPLLSEFLRDCVAYFADRSIPADDEVWEYVADLESALTDGRQHLLILDGLEILAGKTAWSGSAPSSLAWLMDMIRHVTKASQAVRFLLTSRDLEFPEDWSVIKLDAMGFELTVAQDGTGDYKSIEEAVSAATSGSRITVRRGVYYENVELKPEIALTGDDIDSVVIDGRGRGWVVKAADGCTISGLTIQNSGHETGVSDCGVMVEACKDCTVSGNRIIRNGHYGIILRNCRARIVENEIAENEILGIYIDSGAEFEISANILADHRHSALDINAGDSKGIIRNNNLLNAEYGIYYGSRLTKPLPLSIINNIFYKNVDAIHTPYPFAAEIGYNLFFANKQDWYDWDKNTSIDLESSSIFEDPLFINADAGDYHLSPESPARRAGKDGADVGAFAFEDTADVTEDAAETETPTATSTVELKAKLKMMPKDQMAVLKVTSARPLGTIRLVGDILETLEKNRKNRLPILDDSDHPKYMVHRSMIDRYLTQKNIKDGLSADRLQELTLQNLLDEDAELRKMFEYGFATINEDASLYATKHAMEQVQNCLDIFITKNGARDEPVIGWLTNLIIMHSARVKFREARLTMIPTDEIVALIIKSDRRLSEIRLVGDILETLEKNRKNRLPIFYENDYPRFLIHRSMIDRYLTQKIIEYGLSAYRLLELTLQDLLDEVAGIREMFEYGFATIKADADLAEAKSAMEQTRDCLDVFMTRNGTKNEPVIGWLTNHTIMQNAEF